MGETKGNALSRMIDAVSRLKEEGVEILALNVGEPNCNTPEAIKNETIRAICENQTHYASSPKGELVLREAIAESLKTDTGIDYDPNTEILVTTSCGEGILAAMTGLIGRDEEIIVLTPAFPMYAMTAAITGGKAVEIPLRKENGYQPDAAEIEAAVTEWTKMIVINNPNNPSGGVYTKAALEQIAVVARRHDLLVLSDEIYNRITYGEEEVVSIASFPGMRERTIILNGFSKVYAMTGWRLGYVAAPAELLAPIEKIHYCATTFSPTFIQIGTARGMKTESAVFEVAQMMKQFTKQRETVLTALDKMPELSYIPPQGAFYVLVNVEATGMDGAAFAETLLNEQHVAVVPGEAFGKDFKNWVRISYAASVETLQASLDRIQAFLAARK